MGYLDGWPNTNASNWIVPLFNIFKAFYVATNKYLELPTVEIETILLSSISLELSIFFWCITVLTLVGVVGLQNANVSI